MKIVEFIDEILHDLTLLEITSLSDIARCVSSHGNFRQAVLLLTNSKVAQNYLNNLSSVFFDDSRFDIQLSGLIVLAAYSNCENILSRAAKLTDNYHYSKGMCISHMLQEQVVNEIRKPA
jgi:hypothetical protein